MTSNLSATGGRMEITKICLIDLSDMEIGDRVKVVRIDDYTRDVCEAQGARTSIGLIGIVVDKYYNHNMRQFEVIIEGEGNRWIFEEWQLMKI